MTTCRILIGILVCITGFVIMAAKGAPNFPEPKSYTHRDLVYFWITVAIMLAGLIILVYPALLNTVWPLLVPK